MFLGNLFSEVLHLCPLKLSGQLPQPYATTDQNTYMSLSIKRTKFLTDTVLGVTRIYQ